MTADPPTRTSASCKIRIQHEDEWTIAVLSLDGIYTGGKLVDTTPDFSGDILGVDEISTQYTLVNWLAGVTSGALYTFRFLKLPRRRLFISHLSGSLKTAGIQALANGTSVGVAQLSGREAPPLEMNGWQIECQVVSPEQLANGTIVNNGVALASAADLTEQKP